MAIIIKKKAKAPPPEPLVHQEKSKKAKGRFLDGECLAVLERCPNAVVAWWLMASYAYYIHDLPIITDGLYDRLAKDMLARWAEIEHPHKHLITEAHLRAGSLYDVPASGYPMMTKGAASHLIKSAWGVTIPLL